MFNRIFGTRLDKANADTRIDEIVKKYKSWGAAAVWITGPLCRPDDICMRLEQHGLAHSMDWSGMVADYENLPDPPVNKLRMEIVEVKDESTMKLWSKAVCTGFNFNPSFHEPSCNHLSKLEVGGDRPWKHYVGLLDNAPAVTCTIFNGSSAAGIYMVATVPAARKLGCATAITWHAMQQARSYGHRYIVLQASEMGAYVYPKLGFRDHCKMRLYVVRP
jgi:ribosomal protein S18 acetylase RimI-like enzyme